MSAPIGDSDSLEVLGRTIDEWATGWRSTGSSVSVEHASSPDVRGHYRWLIRLKGEEKDTIALWLTLRQRTVHVETEIMPEPESNKEDVYRFALVKNAELRGVHIALGPENGVYLITQIPIGELTTERLDELVGATVTYVDEIFPTVMTMAFPGLYRRRKKN